MSASTGSPRPSGYTARHISYGVLVMAILVMAARAHRGRPAIPRGILVMAILVMATLVMATLFMAARAHRGHPAIPQGRKKKIAVNIYEYVCISVNRCGRWRGGRRGDGLAVYRKAGKRYYSIILVIT